MEPPRKDKDDEEDPRDALRRGARKFKAAHPGAGSSSRYTSSVMRDRHRDREKDVRDDRDRDDGDRYDSGGSGGRDRYGSRRRPDYDSDPYSRRDRRYSSGGYGGSSYDSYGSSSGYSRGDRYGDGRRYGDDSRYGGGSRDGSRYSRYQEDDERDYRSSKDDYREGREEDDYYSRGRSRSPRGRGSEKEDYGRRRGRSDDEYDESREKEGDDDREKESESPSPKRARSQSAVSAEEAEEAAKRAAREERFREDLRPLREEARRQQARDEALWELFTERLGSGISMADSHRKHYTGGTEPDQDFIALVNRSEGTLKERIGGWVTGAEKTQIHFSENSMNPSQPKFRIELGNDQRIVGVIRGADLHVIHAGPGGL